MFSTYHSEMACLIRRVRVGVAPLTGHRAFGERGHGFGVHAFVGGEQRDASVFEFVLELGADVGAAGDPFDRLAHHRDEPPVRAFGLGEQVGDTAVSWDRDVELLVTAAVAAGLGGLAAGLHVVELRDDHEPVGQGTAGGVQLPG